MPLPWTTILTQVPWGDVIGKAPKIADGAKKLWDGMSRKKADTDPGIKASAETPAATEIDQPIRLDMLEASHRKLRSQMLASGELIRELSEQNTQLVAQIEANRRTTRRQHWGLLATAVLAILALAIAVQPRLSEFFA